MKFTFHFSSKSTRKSSPNVSNFWFPKRLVPPSWNAGAYHNIPGRCWNCLLKLWHGSFTVPVLDKGGQPGHRVTSLEFFWTRGSEPFRRFSSHSAWPDMALFLCIFGGISTTILVATIRVCSSLFRKMKWVRLTLAEANHIAILAAHTGSVGLITIWKIIRIYNVRAPSAPEKRGKLLFQPTNFSQKSDWVTSCKPKLPNPDQIVFTAYCRVDKKKVSIFSANWREVSILGDLSGLRLMCKEICHFLETHHQISAEMAQIRNHFRWTERPPEFGRVPLKILNRKSKENNDQHGSKKSQYHFVSWIL